MSAAPYVTMYVELCRLCRTMYIEQKLIQNCQILVNSYHITEAYSRNRDQTPENQDFGAINMEFQKVHRQITHHHNPAGILVN